MTVFTIPTAEQIANRPKLTMVGRLKKTSKYRTQAPAGCWFEVTVDTLDKEYPLRGNYNYYRMCDLDLGLRLHDGTVVEINR